MARRFYLPQPLNPGTIRLEGAEAHHLSRVLRYQAGDEVTLFDGRGTEAHARIESVTEGAVSLEVLSLSSKEKENSVVVTLATAVPKGERFDWLVEKAVELGVDRLVPLITTRSVVNPGAGKLDRLRRTIVEASKQCGRSRLMELAEPLRWSDFFVASSANQTIWVADPSGEPAPDVRSINGNAITVAIGPEGGFTPPELEQACQAGARLVSIAPWILRIETAAVAFAALIAAGVTKAD